MAQNDIWMAEAAVALELARHGITTCVGCIACTYGGETGRDYCARLIDASVCQRLENVRYRAEQRKDGK